MKAFEPAGSHQVGLALANHSFVPRLIPEIIAKVRTVSWFLPPEIFQLNSIQLQLETTYPLMMQLSGLSCVFSLTEQNFIEILWNRTTVRNRL